MRELPLVTMIMVAALAACDDGGGETADAPRTIDASGIDAGPADAPGPSFSGTIAIAEASVNGIPQLGQGLTVDIGFSQDGVRGTVLFEEFPGVPTGCKVWQYTAAEAADRGLDTGSVAITAMDGDPIIPSCTFAAGAGYVCVGGTGTGGSISLVNAMQGLWSFTDDELTSANQVGRYLTITGAVIAANNGQFPIVGVAGADTVIFVNPSPTSIPKVLPATAQWLTVAGAGPIPGTPDPGFLEDDDQITVALTTGGTGQFESFTEMFAGDGVGDDFTLDTASQAVISNIPVDGSSFSLSCEGAGGACGTALGSVVSITTTDGDVTGLPPYRMPPPMTTQISLRCAVIGSGSVAVPAAASAFLMTAGATRLETSFLRTNLQTAGNVGPVPAGTNIVAGHAIAGFTTP